MSTEVILPDSLTTTQRIKDRLAITASGFDTLFLRLISAVSDFIEHECGVASFKEANYVQEKYSFDRSTDKLFLKNIPVSAITAVYYNVGTLSVPVWQTYGADEWSFDGDSGIITLEGAFPIGRKTVAVSYTAGWKISFADAGDITKHNLPADLTEVAEQMVVKRHKGKESVGVDNESFSGASVAWSKMMSDEDKSILQKYKRILFV